MLRQRVEVVGAVRLVGQFAMTARTHGCRIGALFFLAVALLAGAPWRRRRAGIAAGPEDRIPQLRLARNPGRGQARQSPAPAGPSFPPAHAYGPDTRGPLRQPRPDLGPDVFAFVAPGPSS